MAGIGHQRQTIGQIAKNVFAHHQREVKKNSDDQSPMVFSGGQPFAGMVVMAPVGAVMLVAVHAGNVGGKVAIVNYKGLYILPSMIELFMQPETWATLLILTALEIVLSIDNLVFISILSNKLPPHQQKKARRLGLLLAVVFRLALLATAAWLVKMSQPFTEILGQPFSVRDLVLIAGGLFLIWKSTAEIRQRVTTKITSDSVSKEAKTAFMAVIAQIIVIDMVFSIDSIITAVGLAQDFAVMALAVIIAVIVMVIASEPLAKFINHNPTVVMLALAFLIMIGMALVAEGFGHEIPKAFLYIAMVFSLGVELLNMAQRRAERVRGK